MKTIQVDVIFPIPEGWGMCLSCEMIMAQANLDQGPYTRGLEEYPPEWQEDFRRLSAMIFSLADRYPNRLAIRIWDPRSFQGLLKSLRYGVRRYPAFIINGRTKVIGWNLEQVEQNLRTTGLSPKIEQ